MFQSMALDKKILMMLLLMLGVVLGQRHVEEQSWDQYIHSQLSWTHHHPWLFLIIIIILLSPFFMYSYQLSLRLNQQIQEIYDKKIGSKKSD